jgi:hypothetical protein
MNNEQLKRNRKIEEREKWLLKKIDSSQTRLEPWLPPCWVRVLCRPLTYDAIGRLKAKGVIFEAGDSGVYMRTEKPWYSFLPPPTPPTTKEDLEQMLKREEEEVKLAREIGDEEELKLLERRRLKLIRTIGEHALTSVLSKGN